MRFGTIPCGVRIAYLVHFRGGSDTGIFRKVASQAAAWARSGWDVGLFVTTDEASAPEWTALPQAATVIAASTGPRSLFATRERLANALLRWRPDVVYARHTLVYPGIVRIARQRPVVLEVNSDDVSEFKAVSTRRYRFARATRGLLLSRAAGLVFVTHELERNPRFARYRRPSIVIANGIPLDDVAELPAPSNSAPRLIFLGHPHSPWHGLDQLEDMAAAFPDWRFDVVGPDRGELKRDLANVTAHGVLRPEAFRPLLAAADVAIGTLGLYRKNMNEASAIKLREYLASGLPAIIGYLDTDFPDPPPFLLQIPNRDGGVSDSVGAIAHFVRAWMGRRVPREAIRGIDSAAKESARLGFFERFVASRT